MFDDFIATRSQSTDISCKSYIVTVFGDVLSQHGDWLWLGSLIEALAPLGFSERLIRTSVFRLVQDDWLQVKKVGRCSYYAFTDSANRHYEKAARRIYASEQTPWHGNWLLVLPTFVLEPQLASFKRQLHWLGFSSLANGVFAHPSIEQQSLIETLDEMDLNEKVIVFTSKSLDEATEKTLKKLVQQRWHLNELAQQYQLFLEIYQPLVPLVVSGKLSDENCFLLRTLLIHEYRRILLKDHELPQQMLPEQWRGFAAHDVVKQLYHPLAQASMRYITQQLNNQKGLLGKAKASFNKRF